MVHGVGLSVLAVTRIVLAAIPITPQDLVAFILPAFGSVKRIDFFHAFPTQKGSAVKLIPFKSHIQPFSPSTIYRTLGWKSMLYPAEFHKIPHISA